MTLPQTRKRGSSLPWPSWGGRGGSGSSILAGVAGHQKDSRAGPKGEGDAALPGFPRGMEGKGRSAPHPACSALAGLPSEIPGLTCSVQELDDVLMKDVGGKMQADGR